MEKTVNDFRMNEYAYKPITARGYKASPSAAYDINTSDILTRLIQEAGRFCESYASDLFIDWQSVEKLVSDVDVFEKTYLFGFRQNGVDHDIYILSRYNSGAYAYPKAEYRSLWRLDIAADGREITMKLGRVF